MTDRTDAIRARLAAATPGPWKALYLFGSGDLPMSIENEDGLIVVDAKDRFARGDADLIAHAPSDLRFLLAEVEKLRAELNIERESQGILALERERDEARAEAARLRQALEQVQSNGCACCNDWARNALAGRGGSDAGR